MFDHEAIANLDAVAALAAIVASQDRLREDEWRELVLAAHWATLRNGDTAGGGRKKPGTAAGAGTGAGTGTGAGSGQPGAERSLRVGGDGTPRVAEFACGELAVVMGVGYIAAATLIRDAIDLQHRHPVMWAALADGRGRVWKARQVARMAHAAGLTREQAVWLDAATTPYVDTLTWSAFTRLVEARIIEVDPDAAEARREAALLERFVSTGRSNEHGLKTLVARAGAGEIIFFVAVCDRIAQILGLEGDEDSIDVRRSKALAVLANPARALALLEKHATADPHPDDPDQTPLGTEADAQPEPGAESESESAPQTEAASGTDADPDPEPECHCKRLSPEKMRPRAVLYVRISELAVTTRRGVAHVEHGVGPVTVQALQDLLGHHHVTVRPVLDLRDQVPVDAYEVPHDMREALRLARLSSVFPWTRSGASTPDLDHTDPYIPIDEGGPPGQSAVDNLGPMTRFAHRIKTHGNGWLHRQVAPGVYYYRTPHGYWVRVDNDGSHWLGKKPPAIELEP